MSSELYSQAAQFVSENKSFAIATIVRVEGSSSAQRGSNALIDSEGKLVTGWVGGGCAESAIKSEALKCIETERPHLITIDMRDEQLGVGMPCGGKMDVFIEPVLPKPELLIVGHGRIAETLSAVGHIMGFSITVNDPGANHTSFPDASRLVTEDFDLTETPIGSKTFVVIATQHKRDHLWLQRALEGNAAYVALVASRHRARLVLDYLAAAPSAGKDRLSLGTSWSEFRRSHSGRDRLKHHQPNGRAASRGRHDPSQHEEIRLRPATYSSGSIIQHCGMETDVAH
jgi:xanthine dehydrogenase accessory factor